MAVKQKFIKLEREKVREISRIKGVTEATVYNALKFKGESSELKMIQAWALNNGGKLFEEIDNPYKEVKVL